MLTKSILLLFSAGLLADAQAPGTLRERAAKGDPEAQFNLAKMYEAGRGSYKQDYAEAARWYRAAAEQGDAFAQASLGILYRFGKGVPQDLVQAYMWLYLAASQPTGGAEDSIVEMRDKAAARMTNEQIAHAVRLVREWKPKQER